MSVDTLADWVIEASEDGVPVAVLDNVADGVAVVVTV